MRSLYSPRSEKFHFIAPFQSDISSLYFIAPFHFRAMRQSDNIKKFWYLSQSLTQCLKHIKSKKHRWSFLILLYIYIFWYYSIYFELKIFLSLEKSFDSSRKKLTKKAFIKKVLENRTREILTKRHV